MAPTVRLAIPKDAEGVQAVAAAGGNIGLVRSGDRIRLSVEKRSIDLLVDQAELDRRRVTTPPAPSAEARGYGSLFTRSVMQAPDGCDFDFLRPGK